MTLKLMPALRMIAALPILFGACGGGELEPVALPDDAPTLTVCEAATRDVGTRVKIGADFDGFGYDRQSRLVVGDQSGLICNENGAGAVFATLWSSEARGPMTDIFPGTPILIEGTITEVDEGRFVYLEEAVATER